jgi:hypothetical protein
MPPNLPGIFEVIAQVPYRVELLRMVRKPGTQNR